MKLRARVVPCNRGDIAWQAPENGSLAITLCVRVSSIIANG